MSDLTPAVKVNPFNKNTTIFLAMLLVVIMIGEFFMEGNKIATWPAFMVMIFFFMSHMDIKEASSILIGGAFGIFNMVIIKVFIPAVMPIFGAASLETMFYTKLIYIAIFVAAIVYLKDIVPWVFNNYAFMMFTVSAAVAAGNTAAATAAKTVAGAAAKAAAANPEAVVAINAATAKATAATVPITNIYQWMGIYLIVGGLFIAAIYGMNLIMAKIVGASLAD